MTLFTATQTFLSLLLLISIAPTFADSKSSPTCDLLTIDGNQPINLSQYRGKVIYLDFWASWCGPCAESFPFMNRLQADLHSQGLEVIAVNLDEDIADARTFLADHPANFGLVTDSNQQCAQQFGVKAMPSSYLIDRKGNIRASHLGFRAGEAADFRKTLEGLLQEPAH